MTKKEEVKFWILCGGLREDGDVKFPTEEEMKKLPDYVSEEYHKYMRGLLTKEDFLTMWDHHGKIEHYIAEHLEELENILDKTIK